MYCVEIYKSMRQYLHSSAPPKIDNVQDYNVVHAAATSAPVMFVNKLPCFITIVQEGRWSGKSKQVGVVSPLKTFELASNSVLDGDLFHFLYEVKGALFFACRSCNITKSHGPVMIGNISVYPGVYRRDISAGGDLSSINIRNLLPWPIIVSSANNKPVAFVEKNTTLGDPNAHGNITISPSVYYDNNNMGINIGTMFKVYIDNNNNVMGLPSPVPSVVPLYSFIIRDANDNEILIGNTGPIIDKSIGTGTNAKITFQQQTGRAIYRIGDDMPLDSIPPEGVGVRAKNAKGTDYVRANLIYNTKTRSTNTIARHPKLSGNNVVNGLYL